MEQLGDRIKQNYENRARHYLTRRMPVILRIDGVAFHTFTRPFEKPFSEEIIQSMLYSTIAIAKKIQGFKCAFVQSDEVSILLTDYDRFETSAWFDYNKSKVESVTASLMAGYFQRNIFDEFLYKQFTDNIPYFDCRSFNIPREEVVNYFLWRALDWKRNSLNMYCSSFFSHKQLENKNQADKHEMLHNIGKNWTTDLEPIIKNGSFVVKENVDNREVYKSLHDVLPNYDSIAAVLDPLIYCDKKD